MALQRVGPVFQDATDTNETITLEPADSAVDIASAAYTNPVTLAPDRKSLSFKVANGVHSLVINLASPGPDETVQLEQGSTLLVDPTVREHSATCILLIQGT
jgi:hypothetical protein